jgi:error-prone DNA polymerase
MGFWSPGVIVDEARRQRIGILPVDIGRSQQQYTVEGGAIRVGLAAVKGLGEASIERIVEERAKRPFADLRDFCRRTRLARRLIENLILAGAMDGWGDERRQLLWQLARLRYEAEELDLVFPDDGFRPAPMPGWEAMGYEEQVTGLSVGEHPITPYRAWLNAHGILDSQALADAPAGERVVVAGIKIMHQAPPTAKGVHFVTTNDEGGMINLVIHPDVYERYRSVWRGARLLIVEGEVQRKDGVVNVIARRVAD